MRSTNYSKTSTSKVPSPPILASILSPTLNHLSPRLFALPAGVHVMTIFPGSSATTLLISTRHSSTPQIISLVLPSIITFPLTLNSTATSFTASRKQSFGTKYGPHGFRILSLPTHHIHHGLRAGQEVPTRKVQADSVTGPPVNGTECRRTVSIGFNLCPSPVT